jgi:hypothetical protein
LNAPIDRGNAVALPAFRIRLGVMRLVLYVVAAALLVACSDSRIPDTSDAGMDAGPRCSPSCTSGQLCFALAPATGSDAAPDYACNFVPTECTSSPSSCDCLSTALCGGDIGDCAYDELEGYVVLECAN